MVDEIIIGSSDIAYETYKLIVALKHRKELIVSVNEWNLPIFETILELLEPFGVHEYNRENKKTEKGRIYKILLNR